MDRTRSLKVTKKQVNEYNTNGVVCIRGQFNQHWINRMLKASVSQIDNPSGALRKNNNPTDPGQFFAGTHMSRNSQEFMDFALNSPAPEMAAKVMQLNEVKFFYDQLFIKEPGTLAPTTWHNDLPFWPFDGNNIASIWIACTPVTVNTSGLVYVAGSHKWGKLYKPVPAVPIEDFMNAEARTFEDCPMFHKEFQNPKYQFLSWDMEPGDALVHHPLTVHGSGKNASSSQRRVALSLRYFGGDATWHGPRTKFSVPGTEDDSLFTPGVSPVHDRIFPVCWQSPQMKGIR